MCGFQFYLLSFYYLSTKNFLRDTLNLCRDVVIHLLVIDDIKVWG